MKKSSLSVLPGGFLLLASVILIFNFSLNSCTSKDDDLPNDSIPSNEGTFTDTRDGNTYDYKTIGTQIWMTKNLAYLPSVSPNSEGSATAKYYYVFGYNGTVVADAKKTSHYTTYGVLYNWPAAMNGAASSKAVPSGVQGVCPAGWHLPSDEEWKKLEIYLGMSAGAADATSIRDDGSVGRKLKAATGWSQSGNGDNSSGFTALPGGIRYYNGGNLYLGLFGYFHTATTFQESSENLSRNMKSGSDGVVRDIDKPAGGFSVRCIHN
jgi:uncharacterized protein (TIGR02145 family)